MARLDDALRVALRREEPSEGFAERVLARAASNVTAAPTRSWLGMNMLRWAAAVLAVVLLFGGLEYDRQRQRRIQGERAKEQVILALQIAAQELQVVQKKVQELNTGR